MAEKKKFLLRIDENIYTALEKWAADDFRSINAQMEFLLKEALKKAGRQKEKPPPEPTPNE
jgi:hypothetical protein